MGEMRSGHKRFVGNPGKIPFGTLNVDWRIILKGILKKHVARMWTGFCEHDTAESLDSLKGAKFLY